MRIEPYKPLSAYRDFYLAVNHYDTAKFLFYRNKVNGDSSYALRIRPRGYLPRSGIFLATSMADFVKGKKVLDIGTGETGIVAVHCAMHGAKYVVGVDIDSHALKWAKSNTDWNGIRNIFWRKSDLFKKVSGRFDIIASNPPQMPMKKGALHDYGGEDGRFFLEEIISLAPSHLRSGGKLYLEVFDFLNAVKRFNNKPTFIEVLRENGFFPKILNSVVRVVRKNGQTQQSMSFIKTQYPGFQFRKDIRGNYYHRIYVLEATLL